MFVWDVNFWFDLLDLDMMLMFFVCWDFIFFCFMWDEYFDFLKLINGEV